jgi:hypothetical protein
MPHWISDDAIRTVDSIAVAVASMYQKYPGCEGYRLNVDYSRCPALVVLISWPRAT